MAWSWKVTAGGSFAFFASNNHATTSLRSRFSLLSRQDGASQKRGEFVRKSKGVKFQRWTRNSYRGHACFKCSTIDTPTSTSTEQCELSAPWSSWSSTRIVSYRISCRRRLTTSNEQDGTASVCKRYHEAAPALLAFTHRCAGRAFRGANTNVPVTGAHVSTQSTLHVCG